MRVIIDTNIWISLMIGHQEQFIHKLLQNPSVTILSCAELIEEICEVASRKKFSHWISKSDIMRTIELLDLYTEYFELSVPAVTSVRDRKDIYLITLSEQGGADFIVSGDKDLLVLEAHKRTVIVSFSYFRNLVSKMGII